MSEERPASEWFKVSFASLANSLAARYGAAVYLVGSALSKEFPGDFDIRVTVSDDDMVRLFGIDKEQVKPGESAPVEQFAALCWSRQKWARERDRLKQSRRLSRMMKRCVDFQTESVEEAKRYENLPRLRLDGAPDGFFDAGLGDA